MTTPYVRLSLSIPHVTSRSYSYRYVQQLAVTVHMLSWSADWYRSNFIDVIKIDLIVLWFGWIFDLPWHTAGCSNVWVCNAIAAQMCSCLAFGEITCMVRINSKLSLPRCVYINDRNLLYLSYRIQPTFLSLLGEKQSVDAALDIQTFPIIYRTVSQMITSKYLNVQNVKNWRK